MMCHCSRPGRRVRSFARRPLLIFISRFGFRNRRKLVSDRNFRNGTCLPSVSSVNYLRESKKKNVAENRTDWKTPVIHIPIRPIFVPRNVSKRFRPRFVPKAPSFRPVPDTSRYLHHYPRYLPKMPRHSS